MSNNGQRPPLISKNSENKGDPNATSLLVKAFKTNIMIDDLIQTGFIIRTAKLHRWMHANFRAKNLNPHLFIISLKGAD